MSGVKIGNSSVSIADIQKAAKSAGVSANDLAKMASDLSKLSHKMEFADAQGVASLALAIGQAANNLGDGLIGTENNPHNGGGFVRPAGT